MVKTVKTIKILKLKIGQDPKVKDWMKNWTNLKNRENIKSHWKLDKIGKIEDWIENWMGAKTWIEK